MWRRNYDPFIAIWPATSSSYLPICWFIEELSKLSATLHEISSVHPEAPVYLRGDFNVSHSNSKRICLLEMLCSQFNLNEVPIQHPTYHHFVGESSSFLDKILFSSNSQPELLKNIHCKLSEPLINSHHDMLISSWSVPHMSVQGPSEDNLVAPKVDNKRLKVVWCDAGV